VQTEVELESGQSFVIAGLLDRQTTETLSKIPGIGDIPLLGKLFQSKSVTRNNSELLVIITPEIVRPTDVGQAAPELKFSVPFLPTNSPAPLRQPGIDKASPGPVSPSPDSMPIEQLIHLQKGALPPAGTKAP
jgi:pilus assembly protein CpaC